MIYVIARCINLENIQFSYMTLDTIRVAYPTSNICCIYLGDYFNAEEEIIKRCKQHKITFIDWSNKLLDSKTNDAVIEKLFNDSTEDFIVCDSDIVFHKNMEWYKPVLGLAGMYIPAHHNDFIGGMIQSRLHTSLMYFKNIEYVKEILRLKFKQRVGGLFTPLNYFKPFVSFKDGNVFFYDSCTNLYQAIGGENFTKEVLDCYTHLYCGSYREELKTIPQLTPILELHKQFTT